MLESLYLIGSLRNPYLPKLERKLKEALPELEIFAEWFGAGERADDAFKEYHKERGLSYREALKTHAAKHIFEFDKFHLDRTQGAILLMPSGRSCAMEAGYIVGCGKPVFGFFQDGEPEERWELMLQFLTSLSYTKEELIKSIKEYNANFTTKRTVDDMHKARAQVVSVGQGQVYPSPLVSKMSEVWS